MKTDDDTLEQSGAIPPDSFRDQIERTDEVAHYPLAVPADLDKRLQEACKGLLVDPDLLDDAAAALLTGHLILQGPPGTGKSTLARALCTAFGVEGEMATAHEEWSTYEVIGRRSIEINADGQESVVAENGHFTAAALRCAAAVVRNFDDPDQPQAVWLIIDELNRANIDRAFGELFSVLGDSTPPPILLSHQPEGQRRLTTSRRFRIIATINTVDRQFVHALSQGLRRRFTFLTVAPPVASQRDDERAVITAQATHRLSERGVDSTTLAGWTDELSDALDILLELVFSLRSAGEAATLPYLPIGTAPLIDTLELALSLLQVRPGLDAGQALDRACAQRLMPLLEADTVPRESLSALADALKSPLSGRTAAAVRAIAAAGLFAT